MYITKAKRDTAIFGPQQWRVEIDDEQFFFSSKEDVESATRLAWKAESIARSELSGKIKEVLE